MTNDELAAQLGQQFSAIDQHFKKIDERFERIDEQFTAVDKKLDQGFTESKIRDEELKG